MYLCSSSVAQSGLFQAASAAGTSVTDDAGFGRLG